MKEERKGRRRERKKKSPPTPPTPPSRLVAAGNPFQNFFSFSCNGWQLALNHHQNIAAAAQKLKFFKSNLNFISKKNSCFFCVCVP